MSKNNNIPKTNWFDPIFDECHNIDNTSYYLEDLAKAFRITGNSEIADNLLISANQLRASAKAIQRAVGKYINDEVDKGQQAISKTLSTILESGTQTTREIK